MSEERRLFSRVDFQSSVTIAIKTGAFQAELVDISLKGALINVTDKPVMDRGDQCTFELKLDPATAAVKIGACIVYMKGDQLGLRFENPDLDSITHLRRLIELNIGDSALVQKELFFLAGGSKQND